MEDQPIVIVRYHEDGEVEYHVSPDAVLFIVDERTPDDRVYLWSQKESHETIKRVIGNSPIAHEKDDYLSANEIQAIKALLWKNDGNDLALLPPTKGEL